MIIDGYQLYSYDLDLVRPIVVKGQSIASRTGYIVALHSGGHIGYGEVSPLDGFSPESSVEALEQLTRIKAFLLSEPIPSNVENLEGAFENWLGNLNLHPSVVFGIEMASLNLVASYQGVTLTELLSETNHSHISINGLLQGERSALVDQVEKMIASGFTAIKLKVGQDIEEDIRTVRDVTEAMNGKALLHLDANRAWSLDEAIYFGNEVGLASVDYIEEPLKDYKDIPEFFHQTTIPVALDETLRSVDFQEVKTIEGVDVLVLKPSILGGIEKVWRLVQNAKGQGINTLISSIFESSVALLCLANLAGCSFRNNAAGLDTAKWFAQDLLQTPLEILRGRIEIANRTLAPSDINFDLLSEIPTQ